MFNNLVYYIMNTQIVNRRATFFFVGQLNFNESILSKYISEFSQLNLLPSVNKGLGIKITPNGIEPEEVISLDLKKMDETLKVSFGPNRVDIVSTKVDDCWESFNATILRISLILRNERLVFNRLALCANVSFSLDPGVGEQAYRILTNNDDHPVEWQIRKVIRTKFNDSILVNNVYTLSRNAVVVNDTDLSDKLILDLDFNTLSGTSVELIEAIQNSYWESTSAMIDDGIKHYISIFENKE